MSDLPILIFVAAAVVQAMAAILIYRSTRATSGGGGRAGAATDKEAARLLAARARALYAKVDGLPVSLLGPGGDKRLREAPLWSASDVTELRPRSSFLLSLCEEPIASAEAALQWILPQAEKIRSSSKDQGFHYVDFPHDKWSAMHHQALDGLHLLETYGEVAAQTIDAHTR
ncbi:MAG: hypothetical protein ABJB33_05030 [Gemmatimonadota bacterium]